MIWRSEGNDDWGLMKFVAERVGNIGGDKPHHPATSKSFAKVDKDPDWHHGHSTQEQHGPAPALSGQAKNAIAQSAMAMKRRKIEHTFPRIVAACPAAITNPATGKPVDKTRVYDVFRELCYDEESDHPWSHRARFSKASLTDAQIEKRLACAAVLQDLGHTAKWYFEKVVYTDM